MDALLNVGQGINIAIAHGEGIGHTGNIFLNFLEHFAILLNVIV